MKLTEKTLKWIIGFQILTIIIGLEICGIASLYSPEYISYRILYHDIMEPFYLPERMDRFETLPPSATRIWIRQRLLATIFCCRVSETDFLQFAKEQGWKLNSTSFSFNERTGQDLGWYNVDLFPHSSLTKSQKRKFWAYNYIYSNGGGITVIYLRDQQMMYYSWGFM